MNERVKKRIINVDDSISTALKQMDSLDCKLLLVFENDSYASLVSIGDIQRGIIRGEKLEAPVRNILRSNIRVGRPTDTHEFLHGEMKKFRMEFMPLVEEGKLIDVIFWEDVFLDIAISSLSSINLPVVVMAGGMGKRLYPITMIIPKPLIPLGDKPILERIVDKFVQKGIREFYFSVNYKKELIQQYFDGIKDRSYNVSYFEETQPLGTAGSLHLLKGKLNKTFFVTNCDILINDDYAAILDYHKSSGNQLTAVAAVKSYSIPYGILEVAQGGSLKEIKEKPDINFFVNAGMYILEPSLLEYIPTDRVYHITDLMKDLLLDNIKMGVFPVSEGSWMDIGEWNEYNKTAKKLGVAEITRE